VYDEHVLYLRGQIRAPFFLVAEGDAQHFAQIVVAVGYLTASERVQREHDVDQYDGRALRLLVGAVAATTAGLYLYRMPDEAYVVHFQLELAVAQLHLDGEQAGYDVVREVGQFVRPHRVIAVHGRVLVQRPFVIEGVRLNGPAETAERVPEQQFVALAVVLHQINAHRVRVRVARPKRGDLFLVVHHDESRPTTTVGFSRN